MQPVSPAAAHVAQLEGRLKRLLLKLLPAVACCLRHLVLSHGSNSAHKASVRDASHLPVTGKPAALSASSANGEHRWKCRSHDVVQDISRRDKFGGSSPCVGHRAPRLQEIEEVEHTIRKPILERSELMPPHFIGCRAARGKRYPRACTVVTRHVRARPRPTKPSWSCQIQTPRIAHTQYPRQCSRLFTPSVDARNFTVHSMVRVNARREKHCLYSPPCWHVRCCDRGF